MKPNQKQILYTSITLSSIAVVLIAVFGFIIPSYKRKKLGNIQTAIDAIKLAKDPNVVKVISQIPSAVRKMSNSEISDFYKYFYTYIKYSKEIPKEFMEKIIVIYDKYFNL